MKRQEIDSGNASNLTVAGFRRDSIAMAGRAFSSPTGTSQRSSSKVTALIGWDATVCGMDRVRISTTVDQQRLGRARQLRSGRDSELLDAALAALIEQEEHRRELLALDRAPYEDDEELTTANPGIDWDRELPYDGSIPDDVVELARQRRTNG